MATQKINSRSPYFITATGTEGTPEQVIKSKVGHTFKFLEAEF